MTHLYNHSTGGSTSTIESPVTPGLFKYMRTTGLPESERQRLIGRLEGESQAIRFEFATLVDSTVTELKQLNITPRALVRKFSYYDTSLKTEFTNMDSIEDIIDIANDYWSFFNYDLLEYVISAFKLSRDGMERYIVNFKEYCQRRLCECRSDVAGSHNESGRRIVLKMDNKMSVQRSSLQDLRKLQDQASKVTKVTVMQLLKIEEGCLHLIYRIPHESIEKINLLSAEKKRELKEMGVLSITCEKKMIRWKMSCSTLKKLIDAKESYILKRKLLITDLTQFETETTLTLVATEGHLEVDVDAAVVSEGRVKPKESDKIVVKVIPAIHHNREARTLPYKEETKSLQGSFKIPKVLPLDQITTAKADMFELFTEIYIQSSCKPRRMSRDFKLQKSMDEAYSTDDSHDSNTDGPQIREKQQHQSELKWLNRNSMPVFEHSVSCPDGKDAELKRIMQHKRQQRKSLPANHTFSIKPQGIRPMAMT